MLIVTFFDKLRSHRCTTQRWLLLLEIKKKRGKKGKKSAAHGFRRFYALSIQAGFERRMTEMKTKNVQVVNK